MKKSQFIRVISLMLLLTMLLPAVPSLADHITSNGSYVELYSEPDLSKAADRRVRIDAKDAEKEGNWYKLWVSGGYHWVPASSVTVVNAEPTPTETATATPTLAPGATATPTPAKIEGEKDPTFTGEVLSYTVPTGGLFLYSSVGGAKTTESVKAGNKLTLTEVLDSPGWYSLYHNGKAYYVPASILYTGESFSYTVPSGKTLRLYDGVRGVEAGLVQAGKKLTLYPVAGEADWYAVTFDGADRYVNKADLTSSVTENNSYGLTAHSIEIAAGSETNSEGQTGQFYYNAIYTSDVRENGVVVHKAGEVNKGSGKAGFILEGQRINVKFSTSAALSYAYTAGGKTYYLPRSAAATGKSSSGLVTDNDNASFVTQITVKPGMKLWKSKADADYITLSDTTVVYGVKDGDDYYKVTYENQYYYIKISDTSEVTTTEKATVVVQKGTKLYASAGATESIGTVDLTDRYTATKVEVNGVAWYQITELNGWISGAELINETSGKTLVNLSEETVLYKSMELAGESLKIPSERTGFHYVNIVDGDWYSVQMDSLWYISRADAAVNADVGDAIVDGDPEVTTEDLTSQLGYNDVMQSNSYWVTAKTTMKVFTQPKTNMSAYTDTSVSPSVKRDPYFDNATNMTIAAGESFLASPYNTQWYSYIPDAANPKVYYILKDQLSGATATSSMSSVRVTLVNAELYISATSDAVPSGIGPLNGEYVVRPINNTWYSIVYDGLQYYIKASDIDKDAGSTPMPNMTDGKAYRITIGVSGATIYKDSALTDAAESGHLAPGLAIDAKRYSSSVYQVSVGGVYYYISVRDIGAILGGDDAAAASPGSTPEDIGGILEGEKNSEYQNTVMSYTVKSGGLWLFYDSDFTRPALALSSGTKLTLTAQTKDDETVYTTWYGGSQYYAQISTIYSRQDELNASTGYSVTLTGTITLYEKYKHTTESYTEAGKRKLRDVITMEGDTQITRPADMRINVKVASFSKATDAQKNTVAVYSTVIDGKTYYFPGLTTGTLDPINADQSTISTALVASNLDTSLITKLVYGESVPLYITNNTTSKARLLSASAEQPLTLYGVSYDSQWFKVIYDGSAWYVPKTDPAPLSSEQISITNGASSSTFAVVIGSKSAKLYTAPQTNTSKTTAYPEVGSQNYSGHTLPAGTVVYASKYSSTWYSYVYQENAGATPKTLYFQNGDASNSNNTGSISSIIITPNTTSGRLNLYTTTATNEYVESDTNLNIRADGTMSYTVRRINSSWYSISYRGATYYIKATDLNATDIERGTPIATTSVGSKYTIVVGSTDGGMVPFYKSSYLGEKGDTPVGNIAGGTQMTGTKMYVEGDADDFDNPGMYVFAVVYDGITRYISASNVVGVKEGDEATEAKYAEQEAEGNYNPNIPVGDSIYGKLAAGTVVYVTKSKDDVALVLPSTGTYHLTRVDSQWYSLDLGETYYVLASDVYVSGSSGSSGTGTGTGEGANMEIGESTMETLKHIVYYYGSPSDTAAMTGSFSVGQLVRFTKISDYWFEVPIQSNGTYVYVKIADVYSASSGTGTGSSQTTTDGTGIITSYIMITATSGTINMRKQASTTSTIMANIPINTQLKNNGYEVSSKGEVWYKVTYNGVNGYVIGTYVKAVGTVDTSGGTVSPTEDIGRTLYVDTTKVNIRSGAGTNHSIVGYLEKNYALVPTNYAYGNDGMLWYAFAYSGKTAYIRADYLRGGVSSTTELSGNVAIKSGGTNLRSGAGDSFGVIKQLERGVIVTIIGSGTDSSNTLWYRVSLDGVSGYLRKDTVRQLTTAEQNDLLASVAANYTELKYGSKGSEVLALQNQLIATGYLAAGSADGIYGTKTTNAVMAFQRAKGLSATGVATSATQASLFNTSATSTGSTVTLNWFTNGVTLLKTYNVFQVYDVNSGVTWTAKYVEGANHADVVPNTAADAQKLKANNITGSYVRRPVICTINGQKYAGSMYAVGHGTKNFVSFFSGVMCIHFTGSQTHGSGNVDADHQAAIQNALNYGNQGN